MEDGEFKTTVLCLGGGAGFWREEEGDVAEYDERVGFGE